jgi:signal transduction histidine kinase
LHPSILDDLGLVNAIEAECVSFSQREGIQVKFTSQNVPATLPRDVALCLYRIAQESLWNIAKHAHTTEAYVAIGGSQEGIVLSVEDCGAGFDPEQVRGKRGLGLASMEERVRLVGGRVSVRSMLGKGTTVEVCVPLAGGDR